MSAAAASRKSGTNAGAGKGKRGAVRQGEHDVAENTSSTIAKVSVAQPDRESAFEVVPGRSGDHHLARQMLLAIFHGPSSAEFQAQLDDPFYEPTDRLLVRRGQQIIAHALLLKRSMQFGTLRFAVSGLTDLAVLPEYRLQGCGSQLLQVAEQRMVDEGAVLGVLRTNSPDFFLRRGWCVCVRHSYSQAGARAILSRIRESGHGRRGRYSQGNGRYNIRLWRRVEQAALTRLYDENTNESFGPLVRTENYWRWLVNRRGYDRIYVAINGPDKLALDDCVTPIVGYAVMREGSMVEMMTSREHPDAAVQLVTRACGDAIERDLHHVRIDADPCHPVHDLLASAGGERRYHEAESGQVFLVKMLDPAGFLSQMQQPFLMRAKQAGLPVPCDLGLQFNGDKYCLSLSKRSVKLIKGKLGRSYLACSYADFIQLLLGHLDVATAVTAGRLTASTRIAEQVAEALFPRLPLWRPPFDDLRP